MGVKSMVCRVIMAVNGAAIHRRGPACRALLGASCREGVCWRKLAGEILARGVGRRGLHGAGAKQPSSATAEARVVAFVAGLGNIRPSVSSCQAAAEV